MKNRYAIRAAVRVALTVGLAATVSVPAAALAQDSQSPRRPAKLGKVEVTGTRIKRTSLETSQTIVRLNRKQLDATGLTSVGQILRKISSAGTPTNGGYSEGGTGEQRVDLRYLGSKRVLVLVDGHRWVQNNNAAGTGIGLTLGLQGAVDVGTIPFSIVDHIEILENGASALYGSDAIAGVVNIITKKDFHGITATAYYGGYKAPGEAFDGQRQHYSATLGTSSSDKKSNLLFNVSYVKQNPIFARNRDISKYPINYPNKSIALTRGTTFGPYGRYNFKPGSFIPPNGCGGGTLQANGFCDLTLRATSKGAVTPADFRNYTIYDKFNPNRYQYLLTPLERMELYTQGHYDFNENVSFHIKGLYNRRLSSSQFVPSSGRIINPAVNSSGGIPHNGTLTVSRTNPYNPFNMDFVLGDQSNPNVNALFLGHQSNLIGPTKVNVDNRTYQVMGGFSGDFHIADRLFNWDVDVSYGSSTDFSNVTGGEFYQDRVKYALGPVSQCGPGTVHQNCVPLDIFGGPGSLTPAMLDYIQFTSHNTAGHRLRDYTANINSSDIFELPGGPLGFAAGFEHREIDGFVSSDPTVSEGNGTTNVVHSYRGHYHVNAYYGELDIPLLSDLPGADELNVDLAIRESEYSTFPANTSKKAGFKYQPVSDLLLRGSISTGFRAPGINALFAASSQTFPSLTDPCDDYLTSGIPEQAQQICQSQGVPPSYSQQSPILAVSEGGNPHLDAETSLSKTFGFVYSPSWLPGFNISADYYHIEVENAIKQIDGGQLLRGCYLGGDQQLCDEITRGPRGGLKKILDLPTNLGSLLTQGIDYSLNYKFPSTSYGDFTLMIRGTNVREYKEVFPGLGANGAPLINNYVGKQHSTLEPLSAVPHNKANVNLYWDYGNWSANYTLRYISDIIGPCTDSFDGTKLSLTNLGLCTFPNYKHNAQSQFHFGAVAYHDVNVSYTFPAINTKVTLGANNLFNKTPPGLGGIYGAYDTALHDFPGRFVYSRVQVGF